ncbi:MAG: Nramp family divalent metal transporter [Acidobacteriota bacterium]
MKGTRKGKGLLAILGPGVLLAATGVGAGDLATASLTGNKLGTAILWGVLLGGALKFVLTEGLTRWQLATGKTLLEGSVEHLGKPFQIAFLAYLIPWSFFVGSALMASCGVAAHAVLPVFEDAGRAVLVFGILHSLLGVVLIRCGGYAFFEKVMSGCIALMFCTILTTTILLRPDWNRVLSGIFWPSIPSAGGEEIIWTLALMGGVGGTVTILCYGYWIRERGRHSREDLTVCRIDLGVGYFMTALFGMAMVIIGSRIQVTGRGAGLVISIADHLEGPLGGWGRWAFLLGAWGALFSSLLGVWQSVPYLFSDFISLMRRDSPQVRRARLSTGSFTYRTYQYALAAVPILALTFSFSELQKYYSFFGALFMPFLAFILLYLNGQARLVGRENVNRPATTVILLALIAFFAFFGWLEIHNR